MNPMSVRGIEGGSAGVSCWTLLFDLTSGAIVHAHQHIYDSADEMNRQEADRKAETLRFGRRLLNAHDVGVLDAPADFEIENEYTYRVDVETKSLARRAVSTNAVQTLGRERTSQG